MESTTALVLGEGVSGMLAATMKVEVEIQQDKGAFSSIYKLYITRYMSIYSEGTNPRVMNQGRPPACSMNSS